LRTEAPKLDAFVDAFIDIIDTVTHGLSFLMIHFLSPSANFGIQPDRAREHVQPFPLAGFLHPQAALFHRKGGMTVERALDIFEGDHVAVLILYFVIVLNS